MAMLAHPYITYLFFWSCLAVFYLVLLLELAR